MCWMMTMFWSVSSVELRWQLKSNLNDKFESLVHLWYFYLSSIFFKERCVFIEWEEALDWGRSPKNIPTFMVMLLS